MKTFLNKFDYVKVLLLQLSVSFLSLTICRVFFHIFNLGKFDDIGVVDYLTGALFDLYTIGIFFIPYYCFFLIPFHRRDHKLYTVFTRTLFHITNAFLIGINLIDVEFFKFTFKRSGYDVVKMMSYGNDFGNIWDSFFVDYWYLILIGILLVTLSIYLVKKIGAPEKRTFDLKFFIRNVLALLLLVPSLMIMGRGGIGVRPTGVLHAGKYVALKNIPFVLNTGFTFIKSINDVTLDEKKFFSEKELKSIFNPVKSLGGNPRYENNNVVLIIMESFSQEFIGKFSGNESYTPFLDSLITHSKIYPNFWANGKRSIEAIPAIANSIPGLMETPYISSNYSGNNVESIPVSLDKHGYESYFFHGASNGSMNFDAYSEAIGYDHYLGRNEYNNETHFDGNWGIFDEYFFPWMANELPQNSDHPFFATVFSLSSHHPYKIPKQHKGQFKEGPQKIFKAVNYADFSLSLFFEEAKKKDWYENTLFIITADHTADSEDKYFGGRRGQYSIPLILFHPNDTTLKGVDKRISQQADIFPTIVDLVASEEQKVYSYGNSLFRDSSEAYAINYGNGQYHYFNNEYLLIEFKDKPVYLFQYKKDKMLLNNQLQEKPEIVEDLQTQLLGVIQTFHNDMIFNKMKHVK